MFRIINKQKLNDSVTLMDIEAPDIARKALAGQFVIFRIDEFGERVPLTVADTDPARGTVTIIFQIVGRSTMLLNQLNVGDYLLDFVGPLGMPTHLDGYRKVAVVGGGVGCAIAYPSAKALFNKGVHVDMIAGFRSRDIIILEDRMRAVCNNFYLMTDDGTAGEKGFTTTKLQQLLEKNSDYDLIIAIGPVIMMKLIVNTAKPFGVPCTVSLNPIMIDGTGMCGCCRVTVDGKMRFACVEGPDFDGYKVDFDELIKRNSVYQERETHDREHVCKLTGGVRHA
ncbi:MAG: sulfide/dihydroorotate dehydrogenase-like FAD/NAD-binding protein [Clostridiales bacterium]|jgi:ferredoxin--NADP+ reductase|nr:sulfide/dihydroorotate dehydrogenase-like FAD/NAD-binding protein [Clostridiales bacterium]